MEAPENVGMESRPVVRVLFVAPGANQPPSSLDGDIRLFAATGVRRVLEEAGHSVSLTTDVGLLTAWLSGVGGPPPDVILLDCGGSDGVPLAYEAAKTLKNEPVFENAPLLAVLPTKVRLESYEMLRAGCVDDFLAENATNGEILARLDLAGELARLRAELVASREQLSRLTRLDEVTGALNRRYFFQTAHRECSRSRRYGHPLSCLMVDVDHFKALNTTFSFGAGDWVLRTVATILRQWTRDSDLVARFNEHKFAILLPETSVEGASIARDKINKALDEQDWTHEGQELPISVSIGEAELPNENRERAEDDAEDGDGSVGEALSTREALAELLADADAALAVSRKGLRTPEVFVTSTAAPENA